jgi:putative exporter of polyketide antibiotics
VGAHHGSAGVTWPGALAFGAAIGLTFAFVGALTTVLAQVAPVGGTDPHVGALLLLTVVGVGLCTLGISGTTRRDLVVR